MVPPFRSHCRQGQGPGCAGRRSFPGRGLSAWWWRAGAYTVRWSRAEPPVCVVLRRGRCQALALDLVDRRHQLPSRRAWRRRLRWLMKATRAHSPQPIWWPTTRRQLARHRSLTGDYRASPIRWNGGVADPGAGALIVPMDNCGESFLAGIDLKPAEPWKADRLRHQLALRRFGRRRQD